MRSRPDMTVLLSSGAPRPGQLLEVEARLESQSDTPLERVTFDLIGLERVMIRRGRNTSVWKHEHIRQRAEHTGRPLTPGSHSYRARFQLPDGLPPQYLGRYSTVDY